ncbi:hypothetical protein NDU88_000334 [Pleurodeles waltl]|uniref:Secreted protein n=1 Tax=Pleurodeles waltl TaxID=8319 RepID=A0AAV7UPQ0_PLEWA|nr:hypothetical protein NDU88_000334 [Pleurodeles waltl]
MDPVGTVRCREGGGSCFVVFWGFLPRSCTCEPVLAPEDRGWTGSWEGLYRAPPLADFLPHSWGQRLFCRLFCGPAFVSVLLSRRHLSSSACHARAPCGAE